MKTHKSQKITCEHCNQSHFVGPDEYACDQCGATVDGSFNLTAFFIERETVDFHFCGWRCLTRKLPEIQSDHFAALPYLHFDDAAPGQGVKDFLVAMTGEDAPTGLAFLASAALTQARMAYRIALNENLEQQQDHLKSVIDMLEEINAKLKENNEKQ